MVQIPLRKVICVILLGKYPDKITNLPADFIYSKELHLSKLSINVIDM